MRLDTANRSFFALVGLVAVPYLSVGLFGCGLLSYLAYRISTDGLGVLSGQDQDLRPALVFFAVVGAGTLASLWSMRRQWRATEALAGHLRAQLRPARRHVAVAAEQGRSWRPGRRHRRPGAVLFHARPARPRVAITTGLVERVTLEELDAVLAHEHYHVRNRDPLKLVVGRALTRAFFFLPMLGLLHRRYLASRELAADRRALDQAGPRPLAAALLKAVSGPHWSDLGGAAAIAGDEHLELRVDQLERGAEPPLPVLPRAAVGLSIAGLTVLVAALLATVVAAGGPGALMDESTMAMDGWSPPTGLAVAGAALCAGGWMAGGWLLLRRWQARLPHRPAPTNEEPTP